MAQCGRAAVTLAFVAMLFPHLVSASAILVAETGGEPVAHTLEDLAQTSAWIALVTSAAGLAALVAMAIRPGMLTPRWTVTLATALTLGIA